MGGFSLSDSRTSGRASTRWWWWWRPQAGATISVNPVSTRHVVRPRDATALAERLTSAFGAAVSVADAIALAETLAVTVSQPAGALEARLTDAALPSEALATRWSARAQLVDALALDEALATTLHRLTTVSLADRLAIAEALSWSITGLHHAALTDTLALLDSLLAHHRMVDPLADAAAITEALDQASHPADAIVASESIALAFRFEARPPAEVALPSEALALALARPQHFSAGLADAAPPRDAVSHTLTDVEALADAALPGEAITTTHTSHPSHGQISIGDSAPPGEALAHTMTDAEALADTALPGEALQFSHQTGGATLTASVAENLGQAPDFAFGLNALPPGDDELVRFLLFLDANVEESNQLFSAGQPAVTDAGQVIGDRTYQSGSSTVTLTRMRWDGGGQIIINSGSVQMIADAWFPAGTTQFTRDNISHQIVLMDEFGRVLRIPPERFEARGNSFIRFRTHSQETAFRANLVSGRGVLIVVARIGTVRRPTGLGEHLSVVQREPVRLADSAASGERVGLSAALGDEQHLTDAAPPREALRVSERDVTALADSAPPGEALTSHEVRSAQTFHAALTDAALPSESSATVGRETSRVADAAPPREALHTTLIAPPVVLLHAALSDAALPGEALATVGRETSSLADAAPPDERLAHIAVTGGNLYHHSLTSAALPTEILGLGRTRALNSRALNASTIN